MGDGISVVKPMEELTMPKNICGFQAAGAVLPELNIQGKRFQ